MSDPSRWTWLSRRLWHLLTSAEPACTYRWCARPTVGFSVWCRQHTDLILAGESIDDWPRHKRRAS